jgi:hypothetical protein
MTKRPLAVTAILLLFFTTSRAQVEPQIKFGIDAGADFSRLSNIVQGFSASGGTVAKNSQSLTCFTAGAFVDIPLGKKDQFILRPGLRYLGAGGKTPDLLDFNGNLISAATTYTFNYLQLPVQVLYSPSLSFGKPWIGGGFYSGLLVSATAKSNQGSGDLKIGSSANDAVRRMDYGFVATAGLTLKCGVLIGADFQQSLRGIVPNTSSGAKKVKNSIWGLRLGYTLNLK